MSPLDSTRTWLVTGPFAWLVTGPFGRGLAFVIDFSVALRTMLTHRRGTPPP